MSERVILRLSDGWALGADDNQWIVLQWMAPRSPKSRRQGYWNPRAFVGSTKTVLARCLREKKAVVTPEAQAVIDAWPERFLDWRAAA